VAIDPDDPRLVDSGPDALRRGLADIEMVGSKAPGTWPPQLAAAGFLPRHLILDVIPVTPPAERPPFTSLAGAPMPNLDSVQYQELLVLNSQMRNRLGKLPPPYASYEHLALQMKFEALCLRLKEHPLSEDTGRHVPARRAGWAFSLSDRYWHELSQEPVELA